MRTTGGPKTSPLPSLRVIFSITQPVSPRPAAPHSARLSYLRPRLLREHGLELLRLARALTHSHARALA